MTNINRLQVAKIRDAKDVVKDIFWDREKASVMY